MSQENNNSKTLTWSILSLSLLTVMAGAAIAPALDVIQQHFSDCDAFLIQMIVSMPAIFIVIGNAVFPKLTSRYGVKTLVMIGLTLYVVGGCSAGAMSNIYMVLAMRAFVGLGVGILMPLSTGLLSFYFPPSKLSKLMGYSSAMNQMGGVVATLITGVLSRISWRCSFLVYLMGLISVVLCLMFLPNDMLGGQHTEEGGHQEEKLSTGATIREFWPFLVSMFLLMTTFFVYATNFAMITAAGGVIPANLISIIMALMDFVAFFGGLAFAPTQKKLGINTRFVAPIGFLCGYLLMIIVGGWFGVIAGSLLIGFSNGLGIPFLMTGAAQRAGKNAVTTILPLMSAALYLAQFFCPTITSLVEKFAGDGLYVPYMMACVTAALMIVTGLAIKKSESSTQATSPSSLSPNASR